MRAAAFAFALIVAFIGQSARADGPADVINRIYEHYLTTDSTAPAPEQDTSHLSKRLKDAFDAYDKNSSPEYVGALDFDPYIAAQDYELKDFGILSEQVAGDAATIVVGFTNFDYHTELTYSLVREGGAWKVDDIESKDADYPWVLSQILKSSGAPQ